MRVNIWFYFAAVIIGLVGAANDLSAAAMLWMIIPLAILLFAVKLNPFLLTKDTEKVEQYLIRNKQKPVYQFYYGLANGISTDVEGSVDGVLTQAGSASEKAKIRILYHLYKKQAEKAASFLKYVKPLKAREYYAACIALEQGRTEEAREIAKNHLKDPQLSVIEASILLREGLKEQAAEPFARAQSQMRGIEKYLFVQQYTRKHKKNSSRG